jgi:hypothetical protein
LLARLGFVYKKPKHVPGKIDLEKQAKFIAEHEKLRENKGKNDPALHGVPVKRFVDACHPQYNSIPSYGWIRRDFAGTPWKEKSNGGRKRVNIHGAINIETLGTVIDFAKSVNKESSLRLSRVYQ